MEVFKEKKIQVSFKKRESHIYNHILKQLNYSAYLKQLVLDDIERKSKNNKTI